MPPQLTVTGDQEVDALLWLRSVIDTGDTRLIEIAMEAAKRINTPLCDLERRYTAYLNAANPGVFFATFAAIGFGDLERHARRSIEKRRLQIEGRARFSADLWLDMEAERYCIEALKGVPEVYGEPGKAQAAARFRSRPELMPHTLADCLYELVYWHQIYLIRNATDKDYTDPYQEVTAREWFVFGLLAEIRPRHKDEAKAVFRHLMAQDISDQKEVERILENLIV